jgi:hypothetical protein
MDSFQRWAIRHKILSDVRRYVIRFFPVCFLTLDKHMITYVEDLVRDKILSGMLSYVRQAYDHVRRNLVRDKDSSDVRQANFLTLDKPTQKLCARKYGNV